MKNMLNKLPTIAVLALLAGNVFAGEEKHWSKESQEQELRHEISFLAKKLLDIRDEETIKISQEPYTKPFLGVCSEVTTNGVKLTCITPGHNAEAAGLRSGDMIVEINGASLTGASNSKAKEIYFGILGSMKTGQVIEFKLNRGGKKPETIKVTVGQLSHPGYEMTIRRK